jgi:hypothetical protein
MNDEQITQQNFFDAFNAPLQQRRAAVRQTLKNLGLRA